MLNYQRVILILGGISSVPQNRCGHTWTYHITEQLFSEKSACDFILDSRATVRAFLQPVWIGSMLLAVSRHKKWKQVGIVDTSGQNGLMHAIYCPLNYRPECIFLPLPWIYEDIVLLQTFIRTNPSPDSSSFRLFGHFKFGGGTKIYNH